MLTKLENAYLFILRVVVLAAATLALIGVVVGLVTSATLVASLVMPRSTEAQAPGATLGDYVAEKHPQGVAVASDASAATPPETPASIRAAVRSLAHYVRTREGGTPDEAGLTSSFMEKRGNLPDEVQDQYGTSLAALMDQLDNSKGNPLSADQIADLIEWHFEKFKSNVESHATQKAAAQAQAAMTLEVAGAGFVVFLGLVFCFLVVKIERNLRLVHTISASGA